MAISCPADLDVGRLRQELRAMCARLAADPAGQFHFHRGPAYAVSQLGYDAAEIGALPVEVTASFAGVGNPHAIEPIAPGDVVLDIGCGSGTDLLLAARRVGQRGRAIGVDMTADMVERATAGARQMGLSHVEVHPGDATSLPVVRDSVDRVISNGALNLVPEKERALAEIFRVLRPGGRLQIADILTSEALAESARRDVDLWAARIAGALLEAELIDALEAAGFTDVEIGARFDCFAGTTTEQDARRYGAGGANITGLKPRLAA